MSAAPCTSLVATPWRLDLADERLWRDGEHVRLNRKAWLVLRALMERPGVLVTKDELFDAGWPGLAVSEAVLTTAVKELRQAMGDSARNPRIIQTVHGRGYRFLLPVERVAGAPPSPDPPHTLPPGAALALAGAGGQSASTGAMAAGQEPDPGGRQAAAPGPEMPACQPGMPLPEASAASPVAVAPAPPGDPAPPATTPGAPRAGAVLPGATASPVTPVSGRAPGRTRLRWPWPALAGALLALALGLWAVRGGREGEPLTAADLPATSASAETLDRSIAVLPFAELSPGPERWFAAGLTEEIVASLARAPDLRVASRSAAARFGPDADPRTTAQALGVAHIVTGSVRRADGRVRVTAQLVRGADGFQLWAQSFDRPAAESIAIQQDIAFAIARALRSVMEPGRLRAMLTAGTRSVEAYEAYLRGLALRQEQLRAGDVLLAAQAAEAFEKARAIDPDFSAAQWEAAQGWVGRATRLDNSARGAGLDEQTRLARYLERVDAAIASASDPVMRLRYSAARSQALLRPREALDLMQRYLAERRNDIDAWEQLADAAALAGRRDEIARAAERVHSLSMAEGAPRSRAITLTAMVPDHGLAAQRARAQLAVRGDHAVTLYQAHRALVQAGQTAEAGALLPRLLAQRLPVDVQAMAELRQACAEGRRPDAQAALARIERGGDPGTIWQARQLLGDPLAAETLRAFERPESLATLAEFMMHPTFEPRDYPLLMARLGREGVTPPRAIPMPGRCPPPA
jgi:TolB-like protein/DNA-binding winged helix-turn-helix (wHTH) protein